jgi:AAA family ATP:ADP antiporter
MNIAVGSLWQRAMTSSVEIEGPEMNSVLLSVVTFFFLFGSYSLIKPVRDSMGTVYGMSHIQDLFTGTLLGSLIFAPTYSAIAARIRLSTFLPWVYGAIAASIMAFGGVFLLFGEQEDRMIAAAFYIWVSTFNILIISVFWTLMADLFSASQAKRLFGFIAAGATMGGIAGPAVAAVLAKSAGNGGLIVMSAIGFAITSWLITRLTKEKYRLRVSGADVQSTTLDHRLTGNALAGFRLLLQSRYLMWLALFLLLMTWISTIVYIQLGDLITHSYPDRAARTQAFATIDLIVNLLSLALQLFGTSRIIQRFGVTTGLLVNPVIMIIAFLAIALSPILMLLGAIQVVRRVAEYAVAKPTREMLFTVVDQQSKYKAKNVIDTVVYRFGDVSSAWVSSWILPYGALGLAIFGILVCALWFPAGYALGRQYERARKRNTQETE